MTADLVAVDDADAAALARRPVLIVDGDRRVRSITPCAERLLGVRGIDVAGRALGECAIDWDSGAVRALVDEAFAAKRCRRAQRPVRWATTTADLIAAPFGDGSHCALIAEGSPSVGGSRPDDAWIDACGEGVVLFGPARAICAWNRAAEGLLGWTRDQAVGQRLVELLQPVMERLRDALPLAGEDAPDAARDCRWSVVCADGATRRVEVAFFVDRGTAPRCAGAFLRPIAGDEEPAGILVRYEQLVESSQDLIWSVDLAGRWTFLNSASERIYGMPRAELLGRPFIERVAPDQRGRDAATHELLIRGERVERHETRHLRADGTVVDLSFSAMPLRDRGGRIVGTIGTAMDVTERNRSLERLSRSEWRQRRVIDVCPDAIFVLRGSRVAFVNPAALLLLGRDDLVGLDFGELVARRGSRPWTSSIASLDDHRTRFPPVEVRMLRADGEIDVELTGGSFTFMDEEAVLLIARDVSTRKATERALASQRLFNESIITAAPLAICGITRSGTALFVNPAACRTTGYGESELIGADWWSLLVPPSEQASLARLLDAVGSGPVSNHLLAIRTKDGRLRRLSWSCVAGREPARGEALLICLGVDVTDQHAMEIQLLQSQKLESIGQLAAGIAHEINTPTQFVGDNLQFLKEALAEIDPALAARAASGGAAAKEIDYLRHEIPKAIEQSLEGVQRVASIVAAMKDYSHPDGGTMAPVDLNRAIATTLTVARNEYKYLADVETAFDEALPPVCCLIGEINQAVLNIVVNAAHAIADAQQARGRGLIRVSTRREGESVVVAIADTGGGIPSAIADRVFEPFFTTKPVGKGTGQGLFIAHASIVKKHGGSLTFTTEAGKGTTFFLRIPIAPPRPPEGAP